MAAFKPALIIVDLQEDFCEPNGTLAIPSGREIAPVVNELLTLPFALKIATKDWHPSTHISFASTHTSTSPDKKPFISFATITNPHNPSEKYESRLWPDHCIQHTPGAQLIHELDVSKLDKIVEKGTNEDVEMYSAFFDAFENPRGCDSGLSAYLRDGGITDVLVVGLAFEYCVKFTALDARKEGFRTYVLREGTRCGSRKDWEGCERELEVRGVQVVGLDSEIMGRVRELGK